MASKGGGWLRRGYAARPKPRAQSTVVYASRDHPAYFQRLRAEKNEAQITPHTLPYGSAVRDSMGSDSGTVPALWVASRGGTTCSPTASAACCRVGAMDP
jgi:hypothetical protein